MNNKGEQIKLIKEKWDDPMEAGNHKYKFESDLELCKKDFEELGWSEVSDRVIGALLRRVQYLKEEKEKRKETKIEWQTKKYTF